MIGNNKNSGAYCYANRRRSDSTYLLMHDSEVLQWIKYPDLVIRNIPRY